MDQAGLLREMKKTGKGISGIDSEVQPEIPNKHTRVIAVTSGKGGVGKTNIAANIAYILASDMGKKILLFDADAGLANVDVILGITPRYNLFHVLNGERSLSEVVLQGPGGMKILPAASGIQQMAELSRGQKFTLLEELNDLEPGLDFMLIDTAAGIGGNVMYFNMIAKEIIIVISPEPTSLTDAYALIKVLYQGYRTKRFLILVNMVRDSAEAAAVHKRLSNATDHFLNLSTEYLGFIPFDQRVQDAVKEQRILAESFPASKASRHLRLIAKKLCEDRKMNGDSVDGTIKLFSRAVVDRNDG